LGSIRLEDWGRVQVADEAAPAASRRLCIRNANLLVDADAIEANFSHRFHHLHGVATDVKDCLDVDAFCDFTQ